MTEGVPTLEEAVAEMVSWGFEADVARNLILSAWTDPKAQDLLELLHLGQLCKAGGTRRDLLIFRQAVAAFQVKHGVKQTGTEH